MRKRVAPAFTNVGIYSESLVTGVVPRRCSPAVAQDRVITGNVANARARTCFCTYDPATYDPCEEVGIDMQYACGLHKAGKVAFKEKG